jgi:hypothetical protein
MYCSVAAVGSTNTMYVSSMIVHASYKLCTAVVCWCGGTAQLGTLRPLTLCVCCDVQEIDEAAVVDSTGAYEAMLALHHLGDAVVLLQATAATATATATAATTDTSSSTAAVAAAAAAAATVDDSSSVKGAAMPAVTASVIHGTHAWRISDLMSMLYTTPVSRFLKNR